MSNHDLGRSRELYLVKGYMLRRKVSVWWPQGCLYAIALLCVSLYHVAK